MSDLKKKQSFTATAWHAGVNAEPNAKRMGAAMENEGFRSLYPIRGKTDVREGFVASFISEEKAKTLAKNIQAVSADPPPQETLEMLEQRAYEKAFSQGEQAGLEEGRRKSREIIEGLQGILTEIELAWQHLIQTHETQIIDLLCRVTEKVIYGQVALEQEMVKRAIIEALRVVPEPVNVQISVNPKDYEYIETVKEDFFSHIKALKDVSVAPDPAIHQGGCTVKTKFGEVDATLESRLEAVRECLIAANKRRA